MRKILFLSVILSGSFCLSAQKTMPGFSKLGYKKKVMYTSSKGEFEEFHDQTDVVEIGTVLFNTKTKQVVGFVSEDKTEADVSSATVAMSIDPLCERYPWISPYAYCLNNPVRYVDPDGRQVAVPMPLPLPPGTTYPSTNPPPLPSASEVSSGISKFVNRVKMNFVLAYVLVFKREELKNAIEASNIEQENQQKKESENTDNSNEKKINPKREAREKAKEERENQPASEDYVKYKAKEKEKAEGKDARRKSHDSKEKGEPDRSKKRIDDDYKINKNN